jgi:hypothetical protein
MQPGRANFIPLHLMSVIGAGRMRRIGANLHRRHLVGQLFTSALAEW